MAQTIGQHNLAAFTYPINGQTPIDANTVRGNDNTIRTSYNDHDSDAGIHLQSSPIASRPMPGTTGRKWLTTDSSSYRLFFDDGSSWYELSYLSSAGGTVSGNLSVTGTLGVTGAATFGNSITLNGRTYTFPATETANYFLKTNGSGTLTWGTLAETIALTDLSDVVITSATSGQPLVFNGTSWVNASAITAAVTGNASTATALQTARTINGTSFDGTANITVTAAAGTLTGSTLASGVTASSLTSVGTLTSGAIGAGFTAIPNSALANSSVTVNGTSIALGASGTVTAAAGTLTGSTLASGVTASSLTSVGTLTGLTVSGSITASGGTANGVAYLNASKVVTSGSAFTFDGTSAVGLSNANGGYFRYTNTANTSGFDIGLLGGSTDNTGYIYNRSSGGIVFAANAAEGMRLTSTGLGIGTASPLGTLGITGSATTTIVIPRSSNGTAASPVETQLIGSTFTNGTFAAGMYALNSFTDNSGNWLSFKTTDTGNTTAERMRITAAGNLGIGTSSPAQALDVSGIIAVSGTTAVQRKDFGYSSTYKSIQIGASTANVALAVDVSTIAGSNFSGSSQVIIPANGVLFPNAAGTNFVGGIARDGNNRILLGPNVAGGVTSGDVKIDTSGNLGVGVTPSAWGAGKAIEIGTVGNALWSNGAGDTRLVANAYFDGTSYKYATSTSAGMYIAGATHNWYTAASGTAGAAISFTQAMTLTADPFLTLNGAAGDGRLQLSNNARNTASGMWIGVDSSISYILSRGAYPLVFQTDATERARITSGGRFYVGATSGPAADPVSYFYGSAIPVVYAKNAGAGGYTFNSDAASNGGTYYHFQFLDAGTSHGSISSNGTNTAYNTSSDVRLKTNIADADAAGAVIDAIAIRQFDWKGTDRHQRFGVVAQEVESVFPEMVTKGQTADDMWGVDYSTLVPLLVKEIQSLRGRVAALEA